VWQALSQLSGTEHDSVLDQFTRMMLETITDGQRHDTLAILHGGVAMWFVVWPGLHLEMLPQRLDSCLSGQCGRAHRVIENGIPLTGYSRSSPTSLARGSAYGGRALDIRNVRARGGVLLPARSAGRWHRHGR